MVILTLIWNYVKHFAEFFENITKTAGRMNELSKVLSLPTIVTEQYPKGKSIYWLFELRPSFTLISTTKLILVFLMFVYTPWDRNINDK